MRGSCQSSTNKLLPSLLLTVDVHSSVLAATGRVTHNVSAQIIDIRPKGIYSASSVANWVTLHGTAGSRETIGGCLPGTTVTPPASSRPKLHHSGSDKNRSSHCKRDIWRNGDCLDVGLGVHNFTH